ncbi:MAG: alpha-L-fucosidase [Umezawaea sp.]
MSIHLNRRQLLKAGAVGAAAVTLPFTLPAMSASAYTVPAKMQWWYAARFGMFIHFGSYSYRGLGEWAFHREGWSKVDYQTQVSARFNPAGFNAASIVGVAKSAGMKYLVITAKHHEGFAMWDSKVAGFTDTTGRHLYTLPSYTGFRRDLLAELKAECDRQGIVFSLYYSILDWNHPSQTVRSGGLTTMASMTARANYIRDMKEQLRELVTRYDPALLWFDGDWFPERNPQTLTDWWNTADGRDLYDFCVSLKPGLVINERVKRNAGLGDYLCPEQTVPAGPLPRPWETCQTLNGAWGYDSRKENQYKSVRTLVRELVRVVSRDGNYLLNIGPRGDGAVTAGSVNALTGVGAWMSTYGDSVHGTTGSPFTAEPSWGCCTKKSGKLFAHVFTWPSNRQLVIGSLTNTINRVYLLDNPGTSLPFTRSSSGITVTLPASTPNADVSVVVVDVVGEPTTGTPSGTTYQAEQAVLGGGASVESNNAGFTGAGFVNFPASGGSLQLTNVDGGAGGSRALTVRFANGSGSGRTGRLVVNGAGQDITTPATGSWSTWQTVTVTVPLNAGSGNTIRFESTGQDLANIDHIVVT